MSREDPQLRIRLPAELKEKIQDSANKNNRSMNAEIVHIIESYLDLTTERMSDTEVDKIARDLIKRIDVYLKETGQR